MNKNSKIKECIRIWKDVFGDDDEFILSFIKNFYNEENMLYIEYEGKIASMLHIIPFEFNGSTVAYIYAVATEVNMRGRGYAKDLIRQAIEKAKKDRYKALITLPADKKLTAFYSRFGFQGHYAVKFESKEGFDFGTGEKEKDFVMILPIEGSFAPEQNEIILKVQA